MPNQEPENGIHPRRIGLIAELFKTRAGFGQTQYIITTHSPLLPDLMPSEALFVCKKAAGNSAGGASFANVDDVAIRA